MNVPGFYNDNLVKSKKKLVSTATHGIQINEIIFEYELFEWQGKLDEIKF